jgi:glycogen(starch) synthase
VKIALLSFEYPPTTGFGGIGSYTWHHARALAALGHDVHVLAGARQPQALQSEDADGVRVHRFWADGALMRAVHSLGTFRLWWTRQRLQNAWSMYQGFLALQREHQYDVVEMPECGAEGALVTRWMHVPTVVRIHSPSQLIMRFYDVRQADIAMCSAIERQPLTRATALTACSAFVAGEVTATLGIARSMHVISNGLDLRWFDSTAAADDVYDRYALPRRQLMLLFAGRMEPRKGIAVCRDIAASILERFDVTFVFAGDDLFHHMTATVLPWLAGRALKGSIHWLGPLPLPEVRTLTRAADIVLIPSLWENCPYSCLEAMAAGRSIVASAQGGMPELIQDGVNGLLATTGDAASFVERIERLIGDAPLRTRLGAAARETIVRRHAHTDVAQQALDVYRSAIQAA